MTALAEKALALLAILLALVAACADPRPAAAQGSAPRIALVIGNAAYPDSDAELPSPINDARTLGDELKKRGFAVDVQTNLGKDGLQTAIEGFLKRIEPDSVALVFYSGYAIQAGRKNYLIPVDARIWSEPDVLREGVSTDKLLADASRRGANTRVLILDASRRNPFERRYRSFSTGLAAASGSPGTIALYSAAAGSVVNETNASRSLFVTELAKQIGLPGISAEQAFRGTRDALSRATRGQQMPALVSGLEDAFSFDPTYVKPVPPPAPKPVAPVETSEAKPLEKPSESKPVEAKLPEAPPPPPVEPKPPVVVETKPVEEPKPMPPPAVAEIKPARPLPEEPKPETPKEVPKPETAKPVAPPVAPPVVETKPAEASVPETPPSSGAKPSGAKPTLPAQTPDTAVSEAPIVPTVSPTAEDQGGAKPSSAKPMGAKPVAPVVADDGAGAKPPSSKPPVQVATKEPDAAALAEQRTMRDFEEAKETGTKEAFESFLDRHPTGALAERARAEIARIEAAPIEQPESGVKPYSPVEAARKAALDERIARNRSDETAYYERGQFYAQRGETALALADFDQSILMNPSSPEAYNNRCWVRAVANDLRLALADCDQALKLRPHFVDALDSRGFVNLKAGRNRAAILDYDAALKADPNHVSALYGRGMAKRRLGQTAPADKDIAIALQLNASIGEEFAGYGLR